MKRMISMFYFLVCLQNEAFSFPHTSINFMGTIEREVDSFVQIEYAEFITQDVDDDFISISFNIGPLETETDDILLTNIQLHDNANQHAEQEEPLEDAPQNQQANNYFIHGIMHLNIFNYERAARYFEAAHNLGHIHASHQMMFCNILRGSTRKNHKYASPLFSQKSFQRH